MVLREGGSAKQVENNQPHSVTISTWLGNDFAGGGIKSHTLSGDKVSPKKGTNFLWAPAYSPEPPQSSGVLHLVLRDSF